MKNAATQILNLALLVSAFGVAGACSSGLGESESTGATQDKIIYGTDDRKEIGQLTDPRQIAWAKATGVLFDDTDVNCSGTTCTLTTRPYGDSQGGVYIPACSGERFVGQPQGGHCTAFLIGPDLAVSAGHCYDASIYYCAHRPLVFGFQVNASGQATTTVPSKDVYHCASVVAQVVTRDSLTGLGDVDFTIFKLDRPVTGRTPLAIRRTGMVADTSELAVIGSPLGLPMKYAGNAFPRINLPENTKFAVNLDASAGDSGAPVINVATGQVEGIVSSGPGVEWTYEPLPDGGTCFRSVVCDNVTGCANQAAWIHANRISSVVEVLEGRSCYDGIKNAQESDVDCGGPTCKGCVLGKACNQTSDCLKLPDWDCRKFVCGAAHQCVADYGACECATDADCNDGIACTVDSCQTGNYTCFHDATACPPPCTEANAIDMGTAANVVTVRNDACLRVRDSYPFWWGQRTMQLMSWDNGTYPVPFTWTNTCSGSSGSGTFTTNWQKQLLNTTSSACATLIDLNGSGSGNVSLVYYAN